MPSGRFAPSPTGRLHLGNLRTALVAWLFARADGSPFWLRFEDLDQPTVRPEHYRSQLADLEALGLDWDGEPIIQSERRHHYEAALADLADAGHTYPCYCSRRDIREAVQAPNGPGDDWDGTYPGTCRDLSPAERAQRQSEHPDRPPAIRLRGGGTDVTITDMLRGTHRFTVDDVVLCRGDGAPAYNLAVVVDDSAQGIELVVRGDDLLASAATQSHIAHLLGVRSPRWAHVPLVVGPDGKRLAKRDGAITLVDRVAIGETEPMVLSWLAASLNLAEPGEAVTARDLADRFDPTTAADLLPTEPWRLLSTDLEP